MLNEFSVEKSIWAFFLIVAVFFAELYIWRIRWHGNEVVAEDKQKKRLRFRKRLAPRRQSDRNSNTKTCSNERNT